MCLLLETSTLFSPCFKHSAVLIMQSAMVSDVSSQLISIVIYILYIYIVLISAGKTC